VDRFCHYHCDIDEQQGANPSNDTIGERKQAWVRHWYTTRILPEPELMILANAWAQERMLWREAFGIDWDCTLNYHIGIEDLLNDIRGEGDRWNGTIYAAYKFGDSATRKKINLQCRNINMHTSTT